MNITLNQKEIEAALRISLKGMIDLDANDVEITFNNGRTGVNAGTNATLEITPKEEVEDGTPEAAPKKASVKKSASKKATVTKLPIEKAEVIEEAIMEKEVNELPEETEEVVEEATDSEEIEDAESLFS